MHRLASLIGLVAAAALLADCTAIHTAQASFHSSFRESFKTNFVKSCTGTGAGEKLCTCAEAKVAAANTDEQLMKMNADSPETSRMLADVTRACIAGK